mmetsp:Transcript_54790/g.90805  ORF Transcript_54790/g.90805 Transcript_54790/m.90805 type:complete len:121 (-) Transcript_54790:256-618(-)
MWVRLAVVLATCTHASAFAVGLQPAVGRVSTCSSQLSAGELPLVSAVPVCLRCTDVLMAVPKKRQSKMKTRQRKANWFAKARRSAQLALSRAKSAKYKPLEDPKYAFGAVDEDDDDEEEE